jgi:hypothetical protein
LALLSCSSVIPSGVLASTSMKRPCSASNRRYLSLATPPFPSVSLACRALPACLLPVPWSLTLPWSPPLRSYCASRRRILAYIICPALSRGPVPTCLVAQFLASNCLLSDVCCRAWSGPALAPSSPGESTCVPSWRPERYQPAI